MLLRVAGAEAFQRLVHQGQGAAGIATADQQPGADQFDVAGVVPALAKQRQQPVDPGQGIGGVQIFPAAGLRQGVGGDRLAQAQQDGIIGARLHQLEIVDQVTQRAMDPRVVGIVEILVHQQARAGAQRGQESLQHDAVQLGRLGDVDEDQIHRAAVPAGLGEVALVDLDRRGDLCRLGLEEVLEILPLAEVGVDAGADEFGHIAEPRLEDVETVQPRGAVPVGVGHQPGAGQRGAAAQEGAELQQGVPPRHPVAGDVVEHGPFGGAKLGMAQLLHRPGNLLVVAPGHRRVVDRLHGNLLSQGSGAISPKLP